MSLTLVISLLEPNDWCSSDETPVISLSYHCVNVDAPFWPVNIRGSVFILFLQKITLMTKWNITTKIRNHAVQILHVPYGIRYNLTLQPNVNFVQPPCDKLQHIYPTITEWIHKVKFVQCITRDLGNCYINSWWFRPFCSEVSKTHTHGWHKSKDIRQSENHTPTGTQIYHTNSQWLAMMSLAKLI